VFVETITLVLFLLLKSIAGTKYANDFPTPVPASTTKKSCLAKALATCSAIIICPERNSKLGNLLAKSPCSANISGMLSIDPETLCSITLFNSFLGGMGFFPDKTVARCCFTSHLRYSVKPLSTFACRLKSCKRALSI